MKIPKKIVVVNSFCPQVRTRFGFVQGLTQCLYMVLSKVRSYRILLQGCKGLSYFSEDLTLRFLDATSQVGTTYTSVACAFTPSCVSGVCVARS